MAALKSTNADSQESANENEIGEGEPLPVGSAGDGATLLDRTRRDQREAAEILGSLATAIARGELTAPAGFVGRLEGASLALRASVGQLAQAAQLRVPKTVRDIENLITLLRETEAVLERYAPELWQHDPAVLAAALEPAAQPLKALWAQITSATYRAARKQRDPKSTPTDSR